MELTLPQDLTDLIETPSAGASKNYFIPAWNQNLSPHSEEISDTVPELELQDTLSFIRQYDFLLQPAPQTTASIFAVEIGRIENIVRALWDNAFVLIEEVEEVKPAKKYISFSEALKSHKESIRELDERKEQARLLETEYWQLLSLDED